MGLGMKKLLSMSFPPKYLVGERTIILLRNKDVEERQGTVKFILHSKFYGVRLIIKMLEKEI